MKELNLYDKIEELKECDQKIVDAQTSFEIEILHGIRKELLSQISILSGREAERINSILCSN